MPGLDEPGSPDMGTLLAETLATYPDLAALTSITGETLYHAPSLLSLTYAGILDRKTSPLLLFAEEVRRSSAEYPRRLPLELFEQSPFDLSPAQIEMVLKSMAATHEFEDISFVTTSTGAVYLFSSRYLERPYAAFLAERADTGLLPQSLRVRDQRHGHPRRCALDQAGKWNPAHPGGHNGNDLNLLTFSEVYLLRISSSC
jgi:hypothetical protein